MSEQSTDTAIGFGEWVPDKSDTEQAADLFRGVVDAELTMYGELANVVDDEDEKSLQLHKVITYGDGTELLVSLVHADISYGDGKTSEIRRVALIVKDESEGPRYTVAYEIGRDGLVDKTVRDSVSTRAFKRRVDEGTNLLEALEASGAVGSNMVQSLMSREDRGQALDALVGQMNRGDGVVSEARGLRVGVDEITSLQEIIGEAEAEKTGLNH